MVAVAAAAGHVVVGVRTGTYCTDMKQEQNTRLPFADF